MSYINNTSKVIRGNVKVRNLSPSPLLKVTVKVEKSQLEDEHEDVLFLEYDEAVNLWNALGEFISYE